MRKVFLLLALLALVLYAARAREAVPVYGPAHAGVEDADLLEETILDIGVLAINPDKPYSLRVGDGMTKGGVEVHAEGCITNFNGIHVATTNLEMGTWNISYGPWTTSGDYNTFTIARGASPWLRFVREDGEAFMRYSFAILDGFGHDDATHYAFQVAHIEGDPLPVLEVSTNLAAGYVAADTNAIVVSRVDAAHVRMVYEAPPGADVIFFRVFDMAELSTGAYLSVPLVAEEGIRMGTNTWTEWPTNHATHADLAAATNTLWTEVDAIDGRVGDIEADYLTSADAEGYATTGAVASVERRVEALEYPETCNLYWPPEYITNHWYGRNIVDIPTNFPTRKLNLIVCDAGITNLGINLPPWNPGRDVEISVIATRTSAAPTNRFTIVRINNNTQSSAASYQVYSHYRMGVITYDSLTQSWSTRTITLAARPYWWSIDGLGVEYPINYPATVEEWEALRASPRPLAAGLMGGRPQLSQTLVLEDPIDDADYSSE